MSTPQGPQPYRQNWPQYGQPQQYGPPPQYGRPSEGIAVTTHYFLPSWLAWSARPKIFIDGYEIPAAGWGRTLVPAPPGQHHVHVHTREHNPPFRVGKADAVVVVPRGQLVELEYKAPMWFVLAYGPGSLGVGPQRHNGVGTFAASVVLSLVIFVLILIFI